VPTATNQRTETPADTEQNNFLPTLYQSQIHQSKYARWDDSLGRRETWPETVDRYVNFFREHISENFAALEEDIWQEIRQSILTLEVLPSMRALMTAGPALKRDHMAGYNCTFIAIDRPHAFDEALYCLCCGSGVGFSVENANISKLPEVPFSLYFRFYDHRS
jgi:ribonucleoside-triphosphate reductase (thioredoxin)